MHGLWYAWSRRRTQVSSLVMSWQRRCGRQHPDMNVSLHLAKQPLVFPCSRDEKISLFPGLSIIIIFGPFVGLIAIMFLTDSLDFPHVI